MMLSLNCRRILAIFVLFGTMSLQALPARATLATDLQALNTQTVTLKDYLAATQLSADSVCGALVQANQQARALVNSVTLFDASLAAPITVDADTLAALDQLSITSLSLANEALRLSLDLSTLSNVAEAITLKDGIVAMLQLSDDIGSMADRIGEISDKILVMSDNIGLMADRIIATQVLQNQNVALTTQSVLQTQTNALALVSVIETSSYNVSLANLITNGNLLAARMSAVVLSPWTMSTQLASVATDVRTFLDQVKAAESLVSADAAGNTLYVSADTLTQLADLSLMLTSLGTAVDGYVIAIDGLKAMTSDSTLYASLKSMLTLSADIGLMANRILEMGDQILLMADNIGLQADQILVTQQAMNVSVAATQASILGAQTLAVSTIAARSL
jgi:hypothetical protein